MHPDITEYLPPVLHSLKDRISAISFFPIASYDNLPDVIYVTFLGEAALRQQSNCNLWRPIVNTVDGLTREEEAMQ